MLIIFHWSTNVWLRYDAGCVTNGAVLSNMSLFRKTNQNNPPQKIKKTTTDYQTLASLRESDASDASDATLYASMADGIPGSEMAAETNRPRFIRTIRGTFCEREFSHFPCTKTEEFAYPNHQPFSFHLNGSVPWPPSLSTLFGFSLFFNNFLISSLKTKNKKGNRFN